MTLQRVLNGLRRCLVLFEDVGRTTAIIIMTGLIFVQVMLRVFLNWSSPAWEEAARFVMIWSIFLGATVTTREDGHIRMGELFHSMRSRLVFDFVSKLLCFGFMCIFVKLAYDFASYSIEKSMQSIVLGLPLIFVHVSFFACGVLIAFHFLLHLVKRGRQLINYRRGGS
jgi:TRAP-type C4-dicarboxylate transport system permease small subunit